MRMLIAFVRGGAVTRRRKIRLPPALESPRIVADGPSSGHGVTALPTTTRPAARATHSGGLAEPDMTSRAHAFVRAIAGGLVSHAVGPPGEAAVGNGAASIT